MSEYTKDKALDRFILICKPEQSGKTFVMLKKINEFLVEEEDFDKITVNFIFCNNSLLLTKQTKKRCKEHIKFLSDIQESYIEFSSANRKDGTVKNNSSEVRTAIEDGCKNVVCCTNKTRVIDITGIIRRINTYNKKSYNFKIWLDEADKFNNYIEASFIPLTQEYENIEVYMLTATPQTIFKKYKEVRTLPLEITTLPTYHGWNDCIINTREDEAGTTIGFARQIADEMLLNGEFKPGYKGYVPADNKKKTHIMMRDMFIGKGVAVFIVNGEGIELTLPTLPNSKSFKIEKTKELHIHIRELYTKYNVVKWSCVVTGNICVGRGISIQQPDFMFNFGILSNCKKKAEVSQNAGRLKGNFKEWNGYSPPIVYTTEKFDKIAKEFEEHSREIGKIAFNKNGESEEGTVIVTNTEVNNIICSKQWSLIENEFDSLEEANKLLQTYGCRSKKYNSFKRNEYGFILSSTTKDLSVLQYDNVKKEMKNWKHTSTLDIRNNKKCCGRLFVVYKDLNDNKSVKFLVRIAKKSET